MAKRKDDRDDRQAREAAALRANLARRKAQQRGRKAGAPRPGEGGESPPPEEGRKRRDD
jgi:hypothetical protein